MTETLEHTLLQEAQAGDRDAFADLHLILEPDIRRFVRRLLNTMDEFIVDDLVQDVFIAFYQNLMRIQPVENLRPYIYRIARNRCYDLFRQQGRYQTESLDDEPVGIQVSFTESDRQPKPDDLTHWVLLQLEVREAIDNLPETQRQTLMLYSEEGLSYAEIADIMEVSVGTVKSRLFYAKKNLRGLLRPETAAVLDEEFGNNTQKIAQSKTEVEDDERQLEEI